MIKWGIIGCGNVTEVKSGPAFSKVKGSGLYAVMRRDAALAEDYARRHNVPKFYTNGYDLINDSMVDAVYVATPPDTHAEYGIAAIRAGKPVYIEKPMALNYRQCMEINDEGKKHGVPVFVAYYRRALPGFLKVKNLVESGAIGRVLHVHIQLFKSPSGEEKKGNLPWRVVPEVAGAGHFFDLASHQLDWLDYLLGPVQKVRSLVLNQAGLYRAEDFVSAELLFPGSVAFSGTWCFNGPPESDRDIIEIIGTGGSVRFSTFSFENIVVTNGTGRQELVNERPEHVQFYLVDKIVRALNGEGESPSTGLTAARTSRVMDEVVREYYEATRVPGQDIG